MMQPEIRHDMEKCTHCMLCLEDCVSGVMRVKNGDPNAAYPHLCNLCSHCVAVCPVGAVENSALKMDEVRCVDKQKIAPEYFLEILRSRRSVRHYKDRPVEKEVLGKILDAARFSPTSSNDQNVAYIVVTDSQIINKAAGIIWDVSSRAYGFVQKAPFKQILKALKKLCPHSKLLGYTEVMDYYIEEVEKGRDFILHKAPVLILVMAPKKALFACDNCNIAACNITNYANSLGLGTCYIGFMTLACRYLKSLRKLLGIPNNQRVYASLVMGYSKYKHTNTTSRKQPQVHWIG